MNLCASPECPQYATYVSKSPPVASCTNTPNPLPSGSGGAGFSLGTLGPGSRVDGTTTGTAGLSSARRTTGTATGTASREGPTSNSTVTSRGGGGSGTTGGGSTPTAGGTAATGGVGRVVAGGFGVGWLWEAVFMFWGAVW